VFLRGARTSRAPCVCCVSVWTIHKACGVAGMISTSSTDPQVHGLLRHDRHGLACVLLPGDVHPGNPRLTGQAQAISDRRLGVAFGLRSCQDHHGACRGDCRCPGPDSSRVLPSRSGTESPVPLFCRVVARNVPLPSRPSAGAGGMHRRTSQVPFECSQCVWCTR
jgi:hypothetical protein